MIMRLGALIFSDILFDNETESSDILCDNETERHRALIFSDILPCQLTVQPGWAQSVLALAGL